MTVKTNSSGSCAVKRCFLGAISAAVITVLLLSLGSAALLRIDADVTSYGPIVTGAAALGTALSGFISSKKYREKGLMYGGSIGLLLFVITTAVGYAMGDVEFNEGVLYKLLVLLTSGGLGGYFGLDGRAASGRK